LSGDKAKSLYFENSFKVLVKLIKTISFYPSGHPALQGALEEALNAFRALLATGTAVCQVRRDHLLLEGTTCKAITPAAQKVATFFFTRRIHRLVFQQQLSGNDLLGFARVLTMDAAELKRQGGMAEALRELQVAGITVQEMEAPHLTSGNAEEGDGQDGSEAGLFEKGEEAPGATMAEALTPTDLSPGKGDVPVEGPAEEEGGFSGATNSQKEQDLQNLLAETEREKADERYRFLVHGLIPRLRDSLTTEHAPLVIRALMMLATGASDRRASPVRRGTSREALRELQGSALFDLLIDYLSRRDTRIEQRKAICRLMTFFGQEVVEKLMLRLVAEDETATRKYLSDAVVHQGSAAIPVLIPYLLDSRWYVVRNAVAMLGEIREHNSAQHLSPLLSHDDLRVRRETVRALTRIGGDQAVAILLEMLSSPDADLCRQALLSLGALRHGAAVPALLEMIRRPDPFLRRREITREAVWALGEIGDVVAVPDLVALMEKGQFWNGRSLAEVRAAAALALGEIGAVAATSALTLAVQDRHVEVSRAAVQALRRIKGGR
jgi:HEAT repeat protein